MENREKKRCASQNPRQHRLIRSEEGAVSWALRVARQFYPMLAKQRIHILFPFLFPFPFPLPLHPALLQPCLPPQAIIVDLVHWIINPTPESRWDEIRVHGIIVCQGANIVGGINITFWSAYTVRRSSGCLHCGSEVVQPCQTSNGLGWTVWWVPLTNTNRSKNSRRCYVDSLLLQHGLPTEIYLKCRNL